MNSTIVTLKGTTTIPKEIRDILGIKPGSRINFDISDGEVKIRRNFSLDELKSLNAKYIDKKIQKLSIDDLRNIASESGVTEAKKKFNLQ